MFEETTVSDRLSLKEALRSTLSAVKLRRIACISEHMAAVPLKMLLEASQSLKKML
jgi:hypothetical protein